MGKRILITEVHIQLVEAQRTVNEVCKALLFLFI